MKKRTKNFLMDFLVEISRKSCCKQHIVVATHNDFLAILTGGSKIYDLLIQIIDIIKAKWLRLVVAKRSFCSQTNKNICNEREEVSYAICAEFSGISTNYMATQ